MFVYVALFHILLHFSYSDNLVGASHAGHVRAELAASPKAGNVASEDGDTPWGLKRMAVDLHSNGQLSTAKQRRLRKEQTVCEMVEPELQLKTKHKIGLYSKSWNADRSMLKEGIEHHPMLELVEDLHSADFVLWNLDGSGMKDEGTPPSGVPASKLVQMDWSDGAMVLPYIPEKLFVAIFKRSYVRKMDGVLKTVAGGCKANNCFPFGYGVLDQYLQNVNVSSIGNAAIRTNKLMCSLRPWLPPTPESLIRQVGVARNRVLWWLHRDKDLPSEQISGTRGIHGLTDGNFNSGVTEVLRGLFQQGEGALIESDENASLPTSTHVDIDIDSSMEPEYARLLAITQVAVTANPGTYEGDHRMWEHFASGNVVFSDKLHTPLPFAPRPGEHYEEFDVADSPGNEDAFRRKLHRLLQGGPQQDAMACRGFQHALRHHRSVSRIDYVVRSLLEITQNASYTQTGLQLREHDPVPSVEEVKYTEDLQKKLDKNESKPEYLYKIA